MTDTRQPGSLVAGLAIATILALGWFVYQPASSGVFLLDDGPNLSGLTSVGDAETALQFVASGSAGPGGRPLSLATFLPQAAMWNESAAPFIRVNIAIHLLNALLACLFFLQLIRARQVECPNDRLIAVGAMALWLFLPMLASSSLMVVQRMTTLAATFMLLGLNGYLYARARSDASSAAALAGMTAALLLGTLFGVMSKENAALLPSLVLVTEATLLRPPANIEAGKWRTWRVVFLVLPTLLILLFLLGKLPYSDDTVLRRGMTGWQRLVTEARILWEYLFNAFVARPARYGPFHDAYPLTPTILDPAALVALISWLLLITGAAWWRRRYPLAAFSILWFVTGHLLESTTVPLELYFEHRNYVPLLGPAFGLSNFLLSITGQYRNVARLGITAYLLMNIAILFSITSLWGKPLEAASYWKSNSPHSVRAAAHLAARQMTEIGGPVGIVTLQEFVAQHPEHAYLRIHELTVSCRLSSERDYSSLVTSLESTLPSIKFDLSVAGMLDRLMLAVAETGCRGIDRETVRKLAAAVAGNPAYAGDDRYMSSHHLMLAGMAMERGDRSGAMRELEQAREYLRSRKVDALIVSQLAAAGRFGAARDYIAEVDRELPLHPLKRLSAKITLEQLRRQVDALEMRAGDDTRPPAVSDRG